MSSPVPIFGLQNLKDDDGAVIASFDIEVDAPADVRQATEPVEIITPETPTQPDVPSAATPATRIISGTELMFGGAAPLQILYADTRRQDLRIDIYSTAGSPGVNEYVLIGDELAKMSNVMASGTFKGRHAKSVDLTYHTGPLFIVPGPSITAAIEISWRATTY
jgi:hypothetical protein